jgi:gluconokinase
MSPPFVIVMGVTGSGKTTLGRRVAQQLAVAFFDADDYHPPQNVRKMSAGHPLDDADREPWLIALADLIRGQLKGARGGVLACSALKRRYRDVLDPQRTQARWVFLRATREQALERSDSRRDHFMPPALVDSQFETLEEPSRALVVDASLSTEEQLKQVMRAIAADHS